MFRRGPFWLAFVGAPALTACSLLLGEGFTDADSDPTDSGTGADGTSSGGSSGTSGTSSSGGASGDGAPGNDGAPSGDAGPGTDGGVPCPDATVTICDDFERTDPKGTWTSMNLVTGGTLSVATETNGNRFLSSAVTANGGHAQLSRQLAITPAKIHLEVSVAVKSLATAGGVYITGIGMPNAGNPPSLVYFYANDTAVWFVQQIADGVNYYADALTFPIDDKRHRIVLDLTFNGKVTLSIDGTKQIDSNAKTFLVPKPIGVHLGASSIDDLGRGVAVDVDDFVFTAD